MNPDKVHKKQYSQKRLIGTIPKIGIRPVIDGRRKGVRESLEVQTLTMAKTASQFLEKNLTHANGLPVECVIADHCIGGVAEAVMAEEKFRKEGVGLSLTVTPCWCYGTEVMDTDPIMPKAVWGFNGTERPGAVYLAAAIAGYNQKGLPTFSIYGRDVMDKDDNKIPEDVATKLLLWAQSGLAVAEMRGKTYLSIGSVSMGIAGSIINQDFLSDYLGMRTATVDMTEVVRRIDKKIYPDEEYQQALDWVGKYCKEGEDPNPPKQRSSKERKKHEWETVVKMTLIFRDLMVGNPGLTEIGYGEEALGYNAILAGFQGQRQWTDHYPNGDFSEAILNSSFDWTGIREPYLLATENDSLNGVVMLFGHLLTNTAQIFADVRTFWSREAVKRVTGEDLSGMAANGIIHLINSGPASLDGTGEQLQKGLPAMKPFWNIAPAEVKKCLQATKWCAADLGYFRGGGFSSQFLSRGGMPVTMSRINLIKGHGPVLQLAEGYTIELDKKVHQKLDRRTNFTWPTTWFVPILNNKGPFKDVYSVMAAWGANHGAICFGHIGDKLITLASMLRIPVHMHNVSIERIFRPAVWTGFGSNNLETADLNACKTFGPLYG